MAYVPPSTVLPLEGVHLWLYGNPDVHSASYDDLARHVLRVEFKTVQLCEHYEHSLRSYCGIRVHNTPNEAVLFIDDLCDEEPSEPSFLWKPEGSGGGDWG
jgi:hypothetical protein